MNIKSIKKGSLVVLRPEFGRGKSEVVRVTFVDTLNNIFWFLNDKKKEEIAFIEQVDCLAI
jgi:hypothetical protein